MARARARAKTDKLLVAVDDYNRAIALRPGGEPELYIERAEALAKLGDHDAAIRGLDDGISRMGPLVTLQLEAIEIETATMQYDAALKRVDAVMSRLQRKESWFVRKAQILKLAGREPVVFDDLSSGHEHAVEWGAFVKGDIRNAEALRAAIRQYKPDAVMNFAARIEVGEGEKNPAHFYDNNVAGMLTLVRTMLEEGVKTFVFSPTCAIYGDPERLPLTEDLPKRPVSVYGRTKLMCEQMLADMSRAHGLNYAALRYFNAAGADRDGEIGEEHDPETHLIPNALKAAAGLGGHRHGAFLRQGGAALCYPAWVRTAGGWTDNSRW